MKKTILIAMVFVIVLSTELAKADFTFGTPMDPNLGIPNDSSTGDGNPEISVDGLLLLFSSYRPDGYGSSDIWMTTRASTSDLWSAPLNIGPPVNSLSYEGSPSISVDGLCLYFTSDRSGGVGNRDIWVTTRVTTNDPWEEPVNLGPPVNSSSVDGDPEISTDGLVILFNSNRSGGSGEYDIYMASRTSSIDPWGAPVNLGSTINTSGYDGDAEISFDGLSLFFSSYRGGGYGMGDLWMTTRPSISDPWRTPVNLGAIVNSSMTESDPTISADGSTLHFARRQYGTPTHYDIWQASIDPVVDLNGDGIVDAEDMCIVVDNWGTDNKLCDVGPMPWGDGVVDVQDLIVIAEHLFEGAGLVAHWALDETTGDIANDSTGNIEATVYNGQWTDGKIDGALDFNGLTTYMDCGDSLRFGTRKMTLAMWLEPQHMGGMRYILSRAKEGASDFDYVLMRQYEGQVEFAVTQEGSDPVSVMSNATTPLNEWTHVAVCLDGFKASIYISGLLDASAGYGRRIPYNGCRLWISSLGTSTRFYNGKIDDVRFYNIALTAEEIASLAQ